jgi:hypothetical protein
VGDCYKEPGLKLMLRKGVDEEISLVQLHSSRDVTDWQLFPPIPKPRLRHRWLAIPHVKRGILIADSLRYMQPQSCR